MLEAIRTTDWASVFACVGIVFLLCCLAIFADAAGWFDWGDTGDTRPTPQVIYVVPCPEGVCPEVTPFWAPGGD